MPIFVHGMVFVNVPQSSRQAMISLIYEKYFANKMNEVGVILEYGIKLIIGHNELQEAQMLSET